MNGGYLTGELPQPAPQSSAESNSGGGCFIATAAFGRSDDSHVELLRRFRDKYLLKSNEGRSFVSLYWKLSPPIAVYINENDVLKLLVRWILLPVAGFCWISLQTSPVFAVAASAMLIVVFKRILSIMTGRRRRDVKQA